jgi:glycosyltransferase involved in cell wall biosynthesis
MPADPTSMRSVSVIMPARNVVATIGAQLRALSEQTYSGWWELLVVNHDSTDDTEAVAAGWRQRLPHMRLINAAGGRGAGRPRNEGCRLSKGELLLFCDADDVVAAGWMAAMVEGLAAYDAVGGPLERRLLNDPMLLDWRPHRPVDALPSQFGFLPYAHGANCGVRREVWSMLGGFDDSYPCSEDVEFFWRAQLAGCVLGYVPDAVIHYRYRSSLRTMVRQSYDYGRSHARLYQDFSARGMPRSRLAAAGRDWWWLTQHSLDLGRSRWVRGVWLGLFARRCGQVAGSIRSQVGYL